MKFKIGREKKFKVEPFFDYCITGYVRDTEESAANIKKLTATLISTDNHGTSGTNVQTYKKFK